MSFRWKEKWKNKNKKKNGTNASMQARILFTGWANDYLAIALVLMLAINSRCESIKVCYVIMLPIKYDNKKIKKNKTCMRNEYRLSVWKCCERFSFSLNFFSENTLLSVWTNLRKYESQFWKAMKSFLFSYFFYFNWHNIWFYG